MLRRIPCPQIGSNVTVPSQKIPIFPVVPCIEVVMFSTQSVLFRSSGVVFLTPKPSFPILGILSPVRGKRTPNASKLRRRAHSGVVVSEIMAQLILQIVFCSNFPVLNYRINSPSQRARRGILMPRGKNCPRDNFLLLNCRAITPHHGGNFERGENVLYCGGRGNLRGILRDNLG